MNWFNKLKEYIDEFIINPSAWKTLAFRGDKEKIFWYGLQHLVDQTEVSNLKLISKDIAYLRSAIDSTEFVESLKSFYQMLGFQKPTPESLNRLTINAKTLLESAYTAYLAKLVYVSNYDIEDFLQQILKLIETVSNKAIELKDLSDLSWANLDTINLLNKAFDSVDILARKSSYKIPTIKSRYWTLYWLRQHQSLFLSRQRSVKVIGYTLGKAKVSHINLRLLKDTESVELVEDPETCLLPFGKDYVAGIERAWRKRGNVNCCWTLQTERDAREEGDSLSAAVATAFASLVQDSYLADDRVVLGIINDKDDNLVPVGFEEAKLEAAARQGVKLAVLVKRKSTTERLDKHNSFGRLSEHVISELKAQNLNILFIDSLAEAIELVTIRESRLYNVPALTEQFISRKEVISEIKATLLSNQTVELTGSHKVGLQGMGGIGKTWLAKELANSKDPEIWKAFPQGIVWATIGYTADKNYLELRQEEIIEALTGEKPSIGDLLQGTNKLREAFKGKACLLILDDIWTKEQFDLFNVLSKDSKLLITTRNTQLLSGANVKTHDIKSLSPPDAIRMLAKYAGEKDVENLPEEAHKIATKWCRCLPFGLGLCGSLIKVSKWTWKDLLDSLDKVDINDLKNDHFNPIDEAIANNSIKALGEYADYYQEFAVFREDSKITTSAISTLLNYSHGLAERKIRPIVERIFDYGLLLKVEEDTYELHDLLYACLVNRSNQHKKPLNEFRKELGNKLLAAYKTKYGEWHKATEDPYFVKNAAYHFKEVDRDDEFRQLLLDFHYMQAKLNASDINALLADYYLEDRETDLIKKTLALCSHILKKDKSQLASQLIARLKPKNVIYKTSKIKALWKKLKSIFTKSDNTTDRNINTMLNQAVLFNDATWLQPLTNCLTPPDSGLLFTLEGHQDRIEAVVSISEKRLISASNDATLKIWDLDSQVCIATLIGHSSSVKAIALINNKRLISASNDATLKIWDLDSKTCIGELKSHYSDITDIIVVNEKRAITACFSGMLEVWDLDSLQCVAVLNGYAAPCSKPFRRIWLLAHIKEYKVIISSSITSVNIWDEDDLYCIASLDRHYFDSNGTFRSAFDAEQATIKIGKKLIMILRTASVDKHDIETQDLDEQEVILIQKMLEILLNGHSDMVGIWDLDKQEFIFAKNRSELDVKPLRAIDGKKIIITNNKKNNHTIQVWSSVEQSQTTNSKDSNKCINAISIIPNTNKAISVSNDHLLRIWSLETQTCIATLAGHSSAVNAVAVIDNGKKAISSSANTLKIWDLDSQNCITTLEIDSLRDIESKSFKHRLGLSIDTGEFFVPKSPIIVVEKGEKLISADKNNKLKIWSLQTLSCTGMFSDHPSQITSLATLGDKKFISACEDNMLRVWDLDSKACIATLIGHSSRTQSMATIEKGKKVISASRDQTLKVWDLDSKTCIATLIGHSNKVHGVTVTFDERKAISASEDQSLKIWDLLTYREIGCFYGESSFTCCAVSKGNLIVAGDVAGQVYFFRLRN